MPRSGPRRVNPYTRVCKLASVRLSQMSGVQVQAVAAALEIHPFMLSKWRKAARAGTRNTSHTPIEIPIPGDVLIVWPLATRRSIGQIDGFSCRA